MRPQTRVDTGLRNLRDIGGLRTRNGRRIKSGLVLRSDSVHNLTDEGADYVRETIGPRTLIDLRSADEIEREGVGVIADGVRYVHRPFDTGRENSPWGQRGEPPDSLLDVYLWMASASAATIAEVLKVLASPNALPAIVYCTAGKDRTGIAIATLLGSLGIGDRDIILDYTHTAAVKPDRLLPGTHEAMRKLGRQFLEADPVVMRAFLAAIRREHGSVRAYAAVSGLKVRELVALEQALLTDA